MTEPAEALPKKRRIAKRRDFVRAYEVGRKLFSRHSVLFVQPNDYDHSRLGITVTKKVGNAIVRNRLKRWAREVFRHERSRLALDDPTFDIVVNVKQSAAATSFSDYRDDLVRALSRIRKAGR